MPKKKKIKKYQKGGSGTFDIVNPGQGIEYDEYGREVLPGITNDRELVNTTETKIYDVPTWTKEEWDEFGGNDVTTQRRPSETLDHGQYTRGVDFESFTDYLPYGFSFTQDDPEDLRAYAQTTGEKVLHGIPKLLSRTGTNVVGSTIGLLYGGVEFVGSLIEGDPMQSAWKSFYDNDFQRSLDGINDWMDEKLPHFYTKEEQDYNFWQSMGTANFWMNDFTQGASFVMGAVISELLTAGVANSAVVSKAAELMYRGGKGARIFRGGQYAGRAEKNIKQLMQKDMQWQQFSNVAVRLRQLGTGAMYEAGVEARHHYDATVERLVQAWKADPENAGKGEPSKEDMARIVDLATKSANSVWTGNVALVGYGNYIMFPRIFGKGHKGLTLQGQKNLIKEEFKDKIRKYKALWQEAGKFKSFTRNAWRILNVPLYEGFVEEGGQKLLDLSGQYAAEQFYIAKENPYWINMFDGMLNSMEDNFAEAYGSKEGQKEIGIGFLLAFLGVPGFSKSNKWAGGAINRYRTLKEEQKLTNSLVTYFDENPHAIDVLQKHWDALIRTHDNIDKHDFSVLLNDTFGSKNAEHDLTFNFLAKKIILGYESSLKDDIKQIVEMPVDKFRETFKYNELQDLTDDQVRAKQASLGKEMLEKIEEIKFWWNKSQVYTQFGDDQKLALVHAMSMGKDVNKRVDKLRSELENLMKPTIVSRHYETVDKKADIEHPGENEQGDLNEVELDSQEEKDTQKRLKNITKRISKEEKEKLEKSEEGKETKARLGIDEFTDPTHIEEHVYTLVNKIKTLEQEIENLEKDQAIEPTRKKALLTDKLQRLNKLNKRAKDLLAALNKGLDPDLSASEQKMLDQWKSEDPVGYNENSEDAIKIIKDLRKLRARRHRAISYYNELLAAHRLSVREGSTWSKKGTAKPRPELTLTLLKQRFGEDPAKNVSDPDLKRFYTRYIGKYVEFEYTTTGDVQIGDYKRHAARKGKLKTVSALAKELQESKKMSELAAWEEALRQKGIAFEDADRTKTYRVYVKPDSTTRDNSRVLVTVPTKEVLLLLQEKAVLEQLANAGNQTAKKQLEELESTLKFYATGYQDGLRNLDFIKSVKNVKEVDANVVIKEHIQAVIEASETDISQGLASLEQSIGELYSEYDEITEQLELYKETLQSGKEKRRKTTKSKGVTYYTVKDKNGKVVNLNSSTIATRIAKLVSQTALKKLQIEELEIEKEIYSDRLANFFDLRTKLKEARSIQEFDTIVSDFMKDSWTGDRMLLKELEEAGIFGSNPILSGLWKEFGTEQDPNTDVIDSLTKLILGQKEVPQNLIDFYSREVDKLKDRMLELEKTAAKFKDLIYFTRQGKYDLRYSQNSTIAAYENTVAKIQTIKDLLTKYKQDVLSETLKEELQKSKQAFIDRAQRFEEHTQFEQMIKNNLIFILSTVRELTEDPSTESDVLTEDKVTANPETHEMSEEEWKTLQDEASNNMVSKEKDKAKGRLFIYSPPILVHRFNKTAGSHAVANRRVQELEKILESRNLTTEEVNELNAMKAQQRFFEFTEKMSSTGQFKYKDYKLVAVHRNNITDDLVDEILFFENGKYLTKDKIKRKFDSKNEEQEDIKFVVTNELGEPLRIKGQIVYTSMMTTELWTEGITEKGKRVKIYKHGMQDLKEEGRVAQKVKRKYEDEFKIGYKGELTDEAQRILDQHSARRQGILEFTDLRGVNISGKSHGNVIRLKGEGRYRAGETIVTNENNVKHINLDVAVPTTGSKVGMVSIGARQYPLTPGQHYIIKNDNLIKLNRDFITPQQVDNVYNLLRLIALNKQNFKDGLIKNFEDTQYPLARDKQGNFTRLSDRTLKQQIEDIIYYGTHASKRKSQEFAIYMIKDTLFFGENSMDIDQLVNVEGNQELHTKLMDFLRTMKIQVNNPALQKDIQARIQTKTAAKKNKDAWTKKYRKAAKDGKWTGRDLGALYKEANSTGDYSKLQKKKSQKQTWMNANPKPIEAEIPYTQYNEITVNNKLEVQIRPWSNYTEYLLGLGTHRTSAFEIPIRLNMQKDYSNVKNHDQSSTAQFLNIYLIHQNKKSGDFKSLDKLAEKKSEEPTKKDEQDATNIKEANKVEMAPSGLTLGDVKTYTQLSDNVEDEVHKQEISFVVTGINHDSRTIGFKFLKRTLRGDRNKNIPLGPQETEFLSKILYEEINSENGFIESALEETGQKEQTMQDLLNTKNIEKDDSGLDEMSDLGNEDGAAFTAYLPHEEFELMDYAQERAKFEMMIPMDAYGNPIFSIEEVAGLVHGTDYAYFDKSGKILLSTEAQKGAMYHEAFHGITRKLLSTEQRQELYNEVKSLRGKATTYKGEVKKLKDFTNKEADEWLAEEFRQYVLSNGKYKIGSRRKKSLIDRIIDFMFKFFSNLKQNKDLFQKINTGYYNRPIEQFTTYDVKSGAAMTALRLKDHTKKDVMEGMTVSMFEVSLQQNIDIAEFFKTNNSQSEFGKKMAHLYGSFDQWKADKSSKSVFSYIASNVARTKNSLVTKIQQKNITDPSHVLIRDYVAQTELLNVLKDPNLWTKLVEEHVNYVYTKYNFSISSAEVLNELNRKDENDPDVNKDSLGIKEADTVNPTAYLNPKIKFLLDTLPQGNFEKNRSGLYKKAKYGKVISDLYKSLGNKNNIEEMWDALFELSQRNATYRTLLSRLGIPEFTETEINDLTENQMSLILSFFTGFNQAISDHYLQIVKPSGFRNEDSKNKMVGGRALVNANRDTVLERTKSLWKAQFQERLNNTNLGSIKNGVYILNPKHTINIDGISKTLKGWIETPKKLSQVIDLLENLGLTFMERPALEFRLEENIDTEGKLFLDAATKFFEDVLNSENLSNILKGTDAIGRLKTLMEFEVKTNYLADNLQIRTPDGKIKYRASLKHFQNKMADYLKDRANVLEMLEHTNMHGSVYLSKILNENAELEIITLQGTRNEKNQKGVDASKLNKSNLMSLHVNSILQGILPTIKEGNKKTLRGIKVGENDFKMTRKQFVHILKEYLRSEIATANIIYNGQSQNVKGLKNSGLQFFDDVEYFPFIRKEALALAHKKEKLDIESTRIEILINKEEVVFELSKFVEKEVDKLKEALLENNIILENKNTFYNVGIDPILVNNLHKSLPAGKQTSLNPGIDTDVMTTNLMLHILEQMVYARTIGFVEMGKIFYGHMGLYKDLFKRTSLTTSPKKFPMTHESILNWMNDNMPNQINKGSLHTSKVKTMVRKDVIEDSKYLNMYKSILEVLNRQDLLPSMDAAYTNMEVFDGGGFISLDFYRRVSYLTDNWSEEKEAVYQKIANNEEVLPEDMGLLGPMKPQVFAPFSKDNLHLRKGDKFALYPIHPSLSKPLGLRSQETNIDLIFNEMNEKGLDYITFESSTKTGALLNSKGLADPLVSPYDRTFTPLKDNTAIMEYDLQWFGIQIDPDTKRKRRVAAGTQLTSLLPMDIFDTGMLNPLYADNPFSENETWQQAINRYHAIHSALTQKQINALANKLGFIETPRGFRILDDKTSRKFIRETLIEEMQKREMTSFTRDAVLALFDSPSMFLGQLAEKNKMETLLYSIVRNTAVRKEMNGDMVVIQSSVGQSVTNRAVKFKDAPAEIREQFEDLKFYTKDTNSSDPVELAKAKTLAMEVYLPHAFRELLGEVAPGTTISREALEIVGFRIPTEDLNSIEFIKIKDFLPKSAGSVVIVPSEMVGKSGADFDIDKITLYLPNTEYDAITNSIDIIKPIDNIEQLRLLDSDSYMAAATQLLKSDPNELSKFLTSFKNKFNLREDFTALDNQLLEAGFQELDMSYKQPKQVVENELLKLVREVLAHPASFDRLIAPVGDFDLSRLAETIKNKKIASGLTMEESPNLFQKLGLQELIEQTHRMYSTLQGTGVVATNVTAQSKAQRSGLLLRKGNNINFIGINNESHLSLGRVFDLEGNRISNNLRQYMTAYVDGEKNPYAIDINAGIESAGVHMLLLRLGIPLETVVYFMSQPIISDYLNLKSTMQGEHSVTTAQKHPSVYANNNKIVNLLTDKYGKTSREAVLLSKEDLIRMVALPTTGELSMNAGDQSLQLQILEDYLRYKEIAEELRKLQTVTSYDTNSLKNGHELIYLEALKSKLNESEMFINYQGLTEEGALPLDVPLTVREQPSMIAKLKNLFTKLPVMMQNIDFKFSNPAIYSKFIIEAAKQIEEGKTKDQVIAYIQAFDNYLTAEAILNNAVDNVDIGQGYITIAEKTEELFRGTNSLPKRIVEAKRKYRNNDLIQEFNVMLQVHNDPNHFNYTIDGLSLLSNKYDIEDLEYLLESFENLYNDDPALATDIILYSLLSSGTAFSPFSYFHAIPGIRVLEITNGIFETMEKRSKMNKINIDRVYQTFLDNSFDNPNIVKQYFESNWHGKKTFIDKADRYGESHITIKTISKQNQSGLFADPEYNLFYYKATTNVDNDGNVVYTLGKAKGIRNRLIEPNNTILNKNILYSALKSLTLNPTMETKIANGEKTILSRMTGKDIQKVTSGIYQLSNGLRIRLNDLGLYDLNKIKKDFAKLKLDKKSALSDYAKKEGFDSFEAMKKTRGYSEFAQGKRKRVVFSIELDNLNPQSDPTAASEVNPENLGSVESLANLIQNADRIKQMGKNNKKACDE